MKSREIPTDEEIAELLSLLINGGYNCREYGGKERKYKGMTRIDVWNESINSDEVLFRDAADDDLTLLMARNSRYQKIKRNGVFVELYGKKVWFKNDETAFNVGREVYVRYDPANMNEVRVYDRETDSFLWVYQRADYLSIPYIAGDTAGQEKLAVAMANQRITKKAIKQRVSMYTDCETIDVLAARINEAAANIEKMHIQRPENVEFLTVQYTEKEEHNYQNIQITAAQDELAELREMNDRLQKAKGA